MTTATVLPKTVRGWTRRWLLPDPGSASTAAGAPLASRIMSARGLGDPATARAFLEPTLRELHDPSLMPGMDLAAARLLEAGDRGERIVIYGDYDVDGITGSAILFHMLRALFPGANVGTYVPHRLDEGYGINAQAIRALASEGARVIVSVDCGVTAVEPARVALASGVDLIITDHHTPPACVRELPAALAVVHPALPGSEYPFGDLSGSAVAYKLAWRLATMRCGADRVRPDLRALLLDLLGLAALGIIADVVPLRGENRVIARFGLSRVKRSPFEGLRALVEVSGLAGDSIDAEHVGFALAPRLNACGRMGHAREAVELLTVAAGDRAREIARMLSRLNDERRATERGITVEAAALAAQRGMTGADVRAIVLSHTEWHPGVVGIVCSRLAERFGRPTLLLREHNGECHGSGRSVDGFNMHAALSRCASFLTQFGGHDMAAGVRLPAARFEEFAVAFTACANAALRPEDLAPCLRVDCDAGMGELSRGAVEQLERLAPFGRGNPPVSIRIAGVRVRRAEMFGREGRHLSVFIGTEGGSAVMRLVGWNWGERAERFEPGAPIEAVIEPRIETWNGSTRVEPRLLDLREAEARGE